MATRQRRRKATNAVPTEESTRLLVQRQYKSDGSVVDDNAEEETIEVRKFETDPAYIEVRSGVTKDLGNYQFLRVDVGVRLPCYVEEIDGAFIHAGEMVSRKLDEEVNVYLEDVEDL